MVHSVERSHIGPRNVRSLQNFNSAAYQQLSRIGIDISPREVNAMMDGYSNRSLAISGVAMDALQYPQTTPSITTPLQFLQQWLPGFVTVMTAARKIDDLVGITTVGNWEDEQIVQGILEPLGSAVPYGDYTNVPLSSWNLGWTERTVVRFEEGMRVGLLEEARASRIRVNSADQKREAASLALEIQRNAIGFFGYNAGADLTYGFLNDPNLPNYVVVANGATSGTPAWATKTFQDITKDLRVAFATLRVQSQDQIDPGTTPITIALSTAIIDYLTVTTDFGESVIDWLNKNYKNVRVISAPELNNAHGGSNIMVIYAESFKDTSTDDGRTWMQIVPVKFKVLGVEQKAKGYLEDYSNATAGVMLKRPFAVVRYYGL